MMEIGIVIPTWNRNRAESLVASIQKTNNGEHQLDFAIVGPMSGQYLGAIEAMRLGASTLFRAPAHYDWIIFLHDDVEIHDPTPQWLEWFALAEQQQPDIGLLGFGGARGLGHPDLYKYPMNDINRLARSGYVSNTTDAEVHGERSSLPVYGLATLDGFCLGIRGLLYNECSWVRCQADGFLFHGYDHWLALRVRELKRTVGMVPVSCTHKGGGTEIEQGTIYRKWCEDRGTTPERVHIESHELLYNRFRNLLPIT